MDLDVFVVSSINTIIGIRTIRIRHFRNSDIIQRETKVKDLAGRKTVRIEGNPNEIVLVRIRVALFHRHRLGILFADVFQRRFESHIAGRTARCTVICFVWRCPRQQNIWKSTLNGIFGLWQGFVIIRNSFCRFFREHSNGHHAENHDNRQEPCKHSGAAVLSHADLPFSWRLFVGICIRDPVPDAWGDGMFVLLGLLVYVLG